MCTPRWLRTPRNPRDLTHAPRWARGGGAKRWYHACAPAARVQAARGHPRAGARRRACAAAPARAAAHAPRASSLRHARCRRVHAVRRAAPLTTLQDLRIGSPRMSDVAAITEAAAGLLRLHPLWMTRLPMLRSLFARAASRPRLPSACATSAASTARFRCTRSPQGSWRRPSGRPAGGWRCWITSAAWRSVTRPEGT